MCVVSPRPPSPGTSLDTLKDLSSVYSVRTEPLSKLQRKSDLCFSGANYTHGPDDVIVLLLQSMVRVQSDSSSKQITKQGNKLGWSSSAAGTHA